LGVQEEARPFGIAVTVLGSQKQVDRQPSLLPLGAGVAGGKDVDVLASGFGETSHLQTVDVVATLVGPCV
jgi:hypothetical protein